VNAAFLEALLDLLLPGDGASLPGARALGIGLADHGEAAGRVPARIVAAAGGEAAFLAATPADRQAAVAAVQASAPEDFRRFLQPLLADYCEAPAVLEALGGSAAPPQPRGRALTEMDSEALGALERVRARGKIWREV
jgi:hypothetical protein